MSRIIDKDFEQLCGYLKDYSLSELLRDNTRETVIKNGHRTYLATLHLWAQCQHVLTHQKLSLHGIEICSNSQLVPFFREAISDVGNGYFCCLHGAYKPGHMALRSSIENFLRFILGGFSNDALTTTNVSDLFKIAKQATPFQGEAANQYHDLFSSYKELCKFTHSASLEHMSGVHALSHFPSFNDTEFQSWNKHATLICKGMAITLCLADHKIFLTSHYKIKEVLEILLPTSATVKILKNHTTS